MEQRWKEHIRDAHSGKKDKFHNAMREVGIENFYIKDVLEPVEIEELDFQESLHIVMNNSYHCGYNSNGGSCGDLREWYLDYQVSSKALTTLMITGKLNEEEFIRLSNIMLRGRTKRKE